ncbi:hypothetical protein C4544_04370 [candidate division WS5 bacterium]|uniref:DUF5652 domain-containing protein n=1 Tax=candidate division WS5 bacterium TaxID=2093353 RepID=A0A419DCK7_9BACT|nr:MAG: hypothetical protein C4544_04370 [candidate division WS5 bacterium]
MEQFLIDNPWVIAVLILWTLPWKGWALWKAAKNDDKPWFIVMLLVNALAILEIFYIFIFSKRKETK